MNACLFSSNASLPHSLNSECTNAHFVCLSAGAVYLFILSLFQSVVIVIVIVIIIFIAETRPQQPYTSTIKADKTKKKKLI